MVQTHIQTQSLGFTFQIEEGPAQGMEVTMPAGVPFFYHRSPDGGWAIYALRPDDDGVVLRYLGPLTRR